MKHNNAALNAIKRQSRERVLYGFALDRATSYPASSASLPFATTEGESEVEVRNVLRRGKQNSQKAGSLTRLLQPIDTLIPLSNALGAKSRVSEKRDQFVHKKTILSYKPEARSRHPGFTAPLLRRASKAREREVKKTMANNVAFLISLADGSTPFRLSLPLFLALLCSRTALTPVTLLVSREKERVSAILDHKQQGLTDKRCDRLSDSF